MRDQGARPEWQARLYVCTLNCPQVTSTQAPVAHWARGGGDRLRRLRGHSGIRAPWEPAPATRDTAAASWGLMTQATQAPQGPARDRPARVARESSGRPVPAPTWPRPARRTKVRAAEPAGGGAAGTRSARGQTRCPVPRSPAQPLPPPLHAARAPDPPPTRPRCTRPRPPAHARLRSERPRLPRLAPIPRPRPPLRASIQSRARMGGPRRLSWGFLTNSNAYRAREAGRRGPCDARVRVKTGVPSAKQSFFVNRLQRRGVERRRRRRRPRSGRVQLLGSLLYSASAVGTGSRRRRREGQQREEGPQMLRASLARRRRRRRPPPRPPRLPEPQHPA